MPRKTVKAGPPGEGDPGPGAAPVTRAPAPPASAPRARARALPASAAPASAAPASPAPASPAPASPAPAARKARPKATATRRAAFDAGSLAAIHQSLTEQRGELVRRLGEIEEATFNLSQSEASGEVGFDEDSADAGSFTFEREKDLSIANNLSDLLSKIDRALHRIEDGSYGLCGSCGQPIEGPRLKALPHVTLCLKCKKLEERR